MAGAYRLRMGRRSAAVVLVAAALSACGGHSASSGSPDYWRTVVARLDAIGASYDRASLACATFTAPRCRAAVVRYRATLLATRRALRDLRPPDRDRRADRTMHRALRQALTAGRHALTAIDRGDLAGWLEALGEHARAATLLDLARHELGRG